MAHGASAATAALIGNYARVLQKSDKLEEALRLVEEAEGMALEHAGANSPLTISIRLTYAELLLSLERPLQAATTYTLIQSESRSIPSSLLPRLQAVEAKLGLE